MLCDEILQNEGDADVGSDTQVEGGVADPQVGETFVGDGLEHGVEDVLVGEGAVWALLHLLKLRLGVVEG